MNQILFPTDFSYHAQNAFYFAAVIAYHTDAAITMLHVKKDPPHPIKDPFTEEILEWIEEDRYDRCFKQIIDQVPPYLLDEREVKIVLREGPTIKTILEVAGELNTDLIVMGTMGASGMKEVFVGSNTSQLIESSKYHVLAVPVEATFNNFSSIACSVDLVQLDTRAIKKILNFGKLFQSTIRFIHVDVAHNPLLNDKIKKLQEQFPDDPVSFELIKHNDVIKGLNNFLEENPVDLLVIYTHPYTFLQRLFEISYTKKLVLHTETPVLAISDE